MGLVFALQPDIRKSTNDELILKSSKRRFSLGGGLLFAGALLTTMYFAAAPLFRVLMSDGGWLDQLLIGFIYVSIFGYPLIAVYCWFYEEVLVIHRDSRETFSLSGWSQFFGIKWNRKRASSIRLTDLTIENWKGALNVASFENTRTRYATKGHWLLTVAGAKGRTVFEKRAKKDDIELLRSQIVQFFAPPPVINITG